jgi:transposase
MFLHCKIPRIRTVENGVEQVTVLWSREGSRFTLLFEVLSMLLIEHEMLINKIGKVTGYILIVFGIYLTTGFELPIQILI